MSELRPSYSDGKPAPLRGHPAGSFWLPAVGVLAILTGLLLLTSPQLSSLTLGLVFLLLALGTIVFGVYLMSVVMMLHALWLEDRPAGQGREMFHGGDR